MRILVVLAQAATHEHLADLAQPQHRACHRGAEQPVARAQSVTVEKACCRKGT